MQSIGKHLGIFCIIVALIYVLVRFVGLPPELYYAIPPLFLLYMGIVLFAGSKTKDQSAARRDSGEPTQ